MQPNVSAREVRGLTKRFDRPAVDALDLTVRTGEFYALLGPNGAGKTTTLRMVAGLLRPDAGTVSILGIDALADPVAAKQIMACGASTLRCQPPPRRRSSHRSDSSRICMNAARDFPRACGRRLRWRARWFTTRG